MSSTNSSDSAGRAPASASLLRTRCVLAALFLLATTLMVFRISLGSVIIPAGEVLRVLFGVEIERASWRVIIRQFRIPRALAATIAGAALGVSGATMQTLFRNPLAGPFVLGVNAGASLGAAIVLLGSAGISSSVITLASGVGGSAAWILALAAFTGAGVLMIVILAAARIVENPVTLLVVGILTGYAVNSVVSVMIHFAGSEQIQSYVAWTFGSFAGVSRSQVPILAITVSAGLLLAMSSTRMLDAALLGERYAQSLGISPKALRRRVIVSTALLAGPVTAFCGPIAFLGMATPHLVRSLTGKSTHRTLLAGSIAAGASLALAGDIIASVPGSDISLPLNAVTALFGAPVVIAVLIGRTRRGAGV